MELEGALQTDCEDFLQHERVNGRFQALETSTLYKDMVTTVSMRMWSTEDLESPSEEQKTPLLSWEPKRDDV